MASSGSPYDTLAAEIRAPRTPKGDDDLAYLVHYATLAANSHNTQPWQFSRTGNTVIIKPDLARATPAVDPDNHHVFASLGCAAENLMLAAKAAGQNATLHFNDTDQQVEIDLTPGERTTNPLFEAIPNRQCTRSVYDGQMVNAEDQKTLEETAQVDGCKTIFISDKDRIEQVLDFVVRANSAQMADKLFADELKTWLRFNARNAIATRDGLYAACFGNPTVPTWLGRLMFGFVFKPGPEKKKYARQLQSSAGIAVFIADKNDPAHWVQAGRSYQRFALQATALGIRHAFINQPVEVAAIRPAFAQWLGVGDRRPNLIVRYGYAPLMPSSLRRPVEAVMT